MIWLSNAVIIYVYVHQTDVYLVVSSMYLIFLQNWFENDSNCVRRMTCRTLNVKYNGPCRQFRIAICDESITRSQHDFSDEQCSVNNVQCSHIQCNKYTMAWNVFESRKSNKFPTDYLSQQPRDSNVILANYRWVFGTM